MNVTDGGAVVVLAPNVTDEAMVSAVVGATEVVAARDESGAAVGGVSPHDATTAASARIAGERRRAAQPAVSTVQ